jgi:hypothetical protein
MARKLRIQPAGAVHHVMNLGDRREAIFHDDKNRRFFLETLAEACAKTGLEAHGFVSCRFIFIWWWRRHSPTSWPA